MDNIYIIVIAALAAIVVIVALLIFGYWYIKRKIQHKIIDVGAGIINKTSEKYLDEKTASKVNNVTNIAAETLKKGNATTTVAKKVLDCVTSGDTNKANQTPPVQPPSSPS